MALGADFLQLHTSRCVPISRRIYPFIFKLALTNHPGLPMTVAFNEPATPAALGGKRLSQPGTGSWAWGLPTGRFSAEIERFHGMTEQNSGGCSYLRRRLQKPTKR
jgi:hypothetical protein